MESTDELKKLIRGRWHDRPEWDDDHYEEAVSRIEDRRGEAGGDMAEYFFSPTTETMVFPENPKVTAADGMSWDHKKAREFAFELIVMADLAEAHS